MKIAEIGHGILPIPPTGWGAVEIVIWNYKTYLEKAGHEVEIYNDPSWERVVQDLNSKSYDFIHLHKSSFIEPFNSYLKAKYCVTNHHGGWEKFIQNESVPDLAEKFKTLLKAPGSIVLSEKIKQFYLDSGYTNFIRSIRHGVEVDRFRLKESGNGKAICIGVISARKRQNLVAELLKNKVQVDFVGPMSKEEVFNENSTSKYKGEWTKDEIYENLTEYSCFILLSDSEASTPLVVLEALAAGLSVVISKGISINLEEKNFITSINEDELDSQIVSTKVLKAIDQNAFYRKEIRDYVMRSLDYSVIVQDYLKIIDEFRNYSK